MTPENKNTRKKALSGRMARGLLNIFLPLQETIWYLRSARHMTAKNLERMRNALPDRTEEAVTSASPDWKKAVADSGCTPAELDRGYVVQRRRWRLVFWLLTIPVPLTALLPLLSGGGMTLHQISTTVVLFSGGGVAWSKALILSYRLWQLRSRRVSLEEGGTFRHYLTETNAVRDAIRGK